MSNLNHVHFIDLPKITDARGNLSFVEGNRHIPFEIKRVYYLYDVPAGAERGAHAHKELEQVFIPLSGSFDIELNDGEISKVFHLNRPYKALFIPKMLWRELKNFSSGSVCLVLASMNYDENDYFRDYFDFKKISFDWKKL